jgi:dihydropteroate synthase
MMSSDRNRVCRSYTFRGKEFDFSRRTFVMGVLNITPDSFSDGGKYFRKDDAVAAALRMIEEGADIIDIGGESTRPKGLYGEGAEEVSVEEEKRRILPVIEEIASRTDAVLSVDTNKSSVAAAALSAGAVIVNDVSGLTFDPEMADTVSAQRGSLILMHMKGTPKTMQLNPVYADIVGEVSEFLARSIAVAKQSGVEQIMIDPGLGFGKTVDHNLILLKHLNEFESLGLPIVIGPSRKGFIGSLLDLPVHDRLEGTAGAVAASVMNGANIIRVHDVKEMKRVAVLVDAVIHAA